VVVSYVDPCVGDDAFAIQDPAGNDVAQIGVPLINMCDVVSRDGFTVVSNVPNTVSAANGSTVEGDGLVEGTPETGYKFIAQSEPVLFVNRLSQRLSEGSSGDWDVVQAKPTESGFDVLIHGIRSSNPWYMHWTTNSSGRLSEMGEWIHIDDMADQGLEQVWDTDFDGNGVIGSASLRDSDGDGLADRKLRYTAIDGG